MEMEPTKARFADRNGECATPPRTGTEYSAKDRVEELIESIRAMGKRVRNNDARVPLPDNNGNIGVRNPAGSYSTTIINDVTETPMATTTTEQHSMKYRVEQLIDSIRGNSSRTTTTMSSSSCCNNNYAAATVRVPPISIDIDADNNNEIPSPSSPLTI